MQTSETPPRWDMNAIFPGFESPEFVTASGELVARIDAVTTLFDRYGISGTATNPPDTTLVAAFEDVIAASNELLATAWRLEAHCYTVAAIDTGNTVAQAGLTEHQRQSARIDTLLSRYAAWLATLDLEALVSRSTVAAAHSGPLRTLADVSRHTMSQDEEALVRDLSESGANGWSRLYDRVWSSMTVDVKIDGVSQSLPMSRARLLGYSSDRELRQRAYAAEQQSWEAAAIPLAAALNGVKGWSLTLATRRGWSSPLDAALAANRIDHAVLGAMMTAARESFPDFRRYLRAKARLLGLDHLAWYDQLAPVNDTSPSWGFERARAVISQAFAAYSPSLRTVAERAFAEHWLDIEPRPGKRGGAFCIAVGDGTSRVMSNFAPVYGEVRTLAHELGHAYHYAVLHREQRTPLRQMLTPMTLTETASIFCETLICQAALQTVDASERLAILDATLQNACRFVVDVSAGFLLEQRVFDVRRQRELSPGEINGLMVAAQMETYGEAIDPVTFHPFTWASRPHLFDALQSFMNFPYMFGLLFSLGLYARYRDDPAGFSERLDALLASTGESDPATLAASFGIKLHNPAFWRASLDIIRADIDEFERLGTAL